VSIAAGVPGAVLGDSFVLRSVLVHLVSNAVHFSHGADTVTVKLAIIGAKQLQFEVTDTGVGLDAAAEDVFAPYRVRPRPSTPRAGGSSGLGLPACRALLRRMDGDLQCSSAPGQGSVLTALVPLRVPEKAAVTSGGDACRDNRLGCVQAEEHSRNGEAALSHLLCTCPRTPCLETLSRRRVGGAAPATPATPSSASSQPQGEESDSSPALQALVVDGKLLILI
jgi:hypothetical protein